MEYNGNFRASDIIGMRMEAGMSTWLISGLGCVIFERCAPIRCVRMQVIQSPTWKGDWLEGRVCTAITSADQ